jgi:sugar lactone lactonase YvrE
MTERTIFAYDYNAATGDISNERPFYKYDGPGLPDGWKMDKDGCIWQCIYKGGKVLKISPEGKLVGEISIPTRYVTCSCFVGEELWITTAEEDEPEKYPESAKYGGGLFKVNVGVTGVKDYKFKLNKEVPV